MQELQYNFPVNLEYEFQTSFNINCNRFSFLKCGVNRAADPKETRTLP